VGWHVYLI